MKKILLFALSLLAMIAVSCEKDNGELSGDDIIEFKDPHFLKALLTVQETDIHYMQDVDANKDGKISVNEARKVKGLMLYDRETDKSFNIKEMPEIKYFTALEYLDCYDNLLTALDVSNNTMLTILYCDNQLTTLDVSNNTMLIRLYCSENQLTTLDVSNNTMLEYLSCNKNQLTALDVSNNTMLTRLHCNNNQLTALDVSNNTMLKELYCENNQLTSIDLSKSTALTHLYCDGNKLTKIILPANHSLSDYIIEEITSEYGNIIEYR